jgi:hypothetical protein
MNLIWEFSLEKDIEQIRIVISEMSRRYEGRGGEVLLAGVEGNTVKIAPSGFCWR